MASAGLELLRIQLFGRWGSSAFLLYVRAAPLKAMKGLAREAEAGIMVQDLQAQIAELQVQALTLRQQGLKATTQPSRPDLPWFVEEPSAILDGSTATELRTDIRKSSTLIMNDMEGGRLHVECLDDPSRTVCGWLHTNGRTTRTTTIQGAPLCPACFCIDPPGEESSSDPDS